MTSTRSRARAVLVPSLALTLFAGAAPPRYPSPDAHAVGAGYVREALEAMGGAARFRALRGVRVEGIGHTFYLEQSERFEGPWSVRYEQFSELRELKTGGVRRTVQQRDYGSPQFAGGTTLVSGDAAARVAVGPDGQPRLAPGAPGSVEQTRRRADLAPERILLLALDAPELRAGRDTVVSGIPQHVVSFAHDGGTARLFLNAATHLPTVLETRRAYPEDYFWSVWGDVTLRTTFTMWTLEPGGLRYPHQWSTEWDGKPYSATTLTAVRLDADAPADSFAIPAEVAAAYRASLASMRTPRTVDLGEVWSARRAPAPSELRPGVVLVPGGYNVVLVRQPDGIVILETPFSPEYARRVLAETARRFPGERIKAVVSTGDSWTYMGGVREYVARGIPVYALDLNRAVLERVVRAPHTLDPDSLQRAPHAARFRWVSGKTILGTGPNRLELYPVRGSGGERMMMAYFPEHRVLWGSDLVQGPFADGSFFMPQYLSELADAVRREGLAPETVMAMHRTPIEWSRVTTALESAAHPRTAAR
ncbi:MAG: hypothetical protein JO040_10820 [Gemmatimonadetes bacterium]|nr:hypothetical protein [Gemmatimonadota bacterium]